MRKSLPYGWLAPKNFSPVHPKNGMGQGMYEGFTVFCWFWGAIHYDDSSYLDIDSTREEWKEVH